MKKRNYNQFLEQYNLKEQKDLNSRIKIKNQPKFYYYNNITKDLEKYNF